jgi:geranylgeranyl reductase family protein
MPDYDVIIIGGGPTGLSSAITSTKKGNLNTLVLEEHDTIGHPLACGEGISTEKLFTIENMPIVNTQLDDSHLKFQKEDNFIERSIVSQRFFFGKKSMATSQLATVTINRPLFDQLLAKEAESHGAEIKLNSHVLAIERKKKVLEVKTDNEQFTTPLVIGCDGPSAHSVKMMNLTPPSEYVQGIEFKIEGVHTDALDFYFDFEEFPNMHYGWLFPKKIHTNIGVVVDMASEPRKTLENFIQSIGIISKDKMDIVREIAGIIPASGPIPKRYCDNFLAAGDSAGMTNSIFYGGIAIGIHTGHLAGEFAIKAHIKKNFKEEFLSSYQIQTDSEPYTDPAIQKAHNILYSDFTSSELKMFGSLIDGWDITTLNRLQKLILSLKVLLKGPSAIRRLKDMRTLAFGFSKSRDWGF